jgi:CRISPR-associated endonuclease Cas1
MATNNRNHHPSPAISDGQAALSETFTDTRTDQPVAIADGHGITLTVERGHLHLTDGVGRHRRQRTWTRAGCPLRRLIIIGTTGTITLDALRWCDRLNITVAILDPKNGHPQFVSTPSKSGDARLRRAQAVAGTTDDHPIGLQVVRHLLTAKLAGQARNGRTILDRHDVTETIDDLTAGLDDVATITNARQLEASAAAAYFSAWANNPATTPRFANRDLARIPTHWLRFDGRRSVLNSANVNRRAERPVNALLNYLYALAEIEACIAAATVGLDPGIGLLHLDSRGRDSMALDLLEAVRPDIDAWLVDLLKRRTFRARDFIELPDGHVRIAPPLSHDLAATMDRWRREIAPTAEYVGHALGSLISTDYRATTPLTGRRLTDAQDRVRSRKAKSRATRLRMEAFPQATAVQPELPLGRNCVDCGKPVVRARHVRCPECWTSQPGQDDATRRRRGRAIAEARAKLEASKAQDRSLDVGWDFEPIRAALAAIPLRRIMEACGVAKSTASAIRSGRHAPAHRHWMALADVATTGLDDLRRFNG